MTEHVQSRFDQLREQFQQPVEIDGLLVDRNLIIAMEARSVCEALLNAENRVQGGMISLHVSLRSRELLTSLRETIHSFSLLQDRLVMHKDKVGQADYQAALDLACRSVTTLDKVLETVSQILSHSTPDAVLSSLQVTLKSFHKTLNQTVVVLEREASPQKPSRPPKADRHGPFEVEMRQPNGQVVRYVRADIYENARFEADAHLNQIQCLEAQVERLEGEKTDATQKVQGMLQKLVDQQHGSQKA